MNIEYYKKQIVNNPDIQLLKGILEKLNDQNKRYPGILVLGYEIFFLENLYNRVTVSSKYNGGSFVQIFPIELYVFLKKKEINIHDLLVLLEGKDPWILHRLKQFKDFRDDLPDDVKLYLEIA
jgi:hypothetical protein